MSLDKMNETMLMTFQIETSEMIDDVGGNLCSHPLFFI